MIAAIWAGVIGLLALSVALFASAVPTGTIHFPGIVPITILGCIGLIFLVCRR